MSNEVLLSGVTILVVEDDPDTRMLFEVVFRHQGASVLAAPNGFAALSIVQTLHVDVIVSDIGLPGLNGYDLLRKIRALEQENIPGQKAIAHAPAIAVSAYADKDSIRKSVEAGFVLHLSKPANIPGLIAAVAALGAHKIH